MSLSTPFVKSPAISWYQKSLRLASGLAALLVLSVLPAPAEALSNDLRHLLNSTGRNIAGNQSGKFCEPQLFAEVGTSLTHVSRDLSDLVFSGDSSDKHERYEGKIEPHTAVSGGVQATRCNGTFSALWVIKPGTQADAGFIRITANVTSCPCRTSDELKLGYMQFTVPVTRSLDYSGTESFSAGTPRDFVIEAECCNGRKTTRTGGQDAPATAVAPPRAAVTQPPAVTPVPPRASPPPPPPLPPPPPPKPVEKTAWSMENPCPPCQSWKDYLDKTLAEITALEQEKQALGEELNALERAISDRQKQIDSLRTRIKLQEGTGGSASDYPQPGWKTESVTQADGRVKLTVTDASGRVVEESYRERSDLGRMRKQIDELEAASKQDRAKQEQIRQRIASLERGLAAKKKQAEAYRSGLADCIREKCGVAVSESPLAVAVPAPAAVPATSAAPAVVPATPATQIVKPAETIGAGTAPPAAAGPAVKTGCSFTPSQPLEVGPRSEVGSGAERAATKAVGGFLGGLVSQATGGMVSSGGGGEAEAPPLVTNPVPEANKQIFKINDNLELELGTAWTKDGLVISHELIKSPDKGTFHAAAMQRPDCSWALPDDYQWYKLWLEWSLTVNWTRDHYVDGKHVKHEEGGWQETGTRDLGLLGGSQVASAEDRLKSATPIWQRAGFSGATGGIQGMGTLYGLAPEDLKNISMKDPTHFVLHIADPRRDPVRTIPLDFFLVDRTMVQEVKNEPLSPVRVPVLGDIPLLRGLFKDPGKGKDSEALILMLPNPKLPWPED